MNDRNFYVDNNIPFFEMKDSKGNLVCVIETNNLTKENKEVLKQHFKLHNDEDNDN